MANRVCAWGDPCPYADQMTMEQALLLELLWQCTNPDTRAFCDIEFREAKSIAESLLGRKFEIA